jgi:two-component system, OmpR family, sensor kinase
MKRFGLRRRLLLAVSVAVAFALLVLVGGFNVILANVLDRDSRDLVRTRAVAQLDALRVDHGRLVVVETPDEHASDAFVWIFADGRALERPQVAATTERAARDLATRSRQGYREVAATDARLYATPVVRDGKRLGTIVAGVSLAPYEQTRKLALLSSLVLGGVILLLVVLASRWLLAASLRPVVRMTRQAAAWSEHDLEHRFALGPPHDELTELAATLDGLLDRLAASLRHERRFSAELSHELRTPLASVRAESELALKREREPSEYRQALELIQANADQLARTIDALVSAARYEAGGARGTADAQEVAESVARACSALAATRELELRIDRPPHRLRVGVDGDLAERILQPVLENACRYGTTSVNVGIGQQNSSVVYTVDDDGPGVAADEPESIFEPGVRGNAQHSGSQNGAGLGLALARRLARSIDGDVIADSEAEGGRFLVRMPRG